jgi:hypothetical protein
MDELKKTTYSYKNRFKFRKIVNRLEKNINLTPINVFLQNYQKYMYSVNTKSRFYITRGVKIKKNMVIPLHINNKVTGKQHLNLLIVNNGIVTRIDPSKNRSIKNKNVTRALVKYFKRFNLQYKGFDKRNKTIKHGGLCRYVTPLVYLYGKSINYRLIKKKIIEYFNLFY